MSEKVEDLEIDVFNVDQYYEYVHSNNYGINWTNAFEQLEKERLTQYFTDKKCPQNNYKVLFTAIKNYTQSKSNETTHDKNIKLQVAYNTLYLTRFSWRINHHVLKYNLSPETVEELDSIIYATFTNEAKIVVPVDAKFNFYKEETQAPKPQLLPLLKLLESFFDSLQVAENIKGIYSSYILM